MGPLVIKERFRESGVTAAGTGAVTCHGTANPPHRGLRGPWHRAGGGRSVTVVWANRGGGGGDSAREGKCP